MNMYSADISAIRWTPDQGAEIEAFIAAATDDTPHLRAWQALVESGHGYPDIDWDSPDPFAGIDDADIDDEMRRAKTDLEELRQYHKDNKMTDAGSTISAEDSPYIGEPEHKEATATLVDLGAARQHQHGDGSHGSPFKDKSAETVGQVFDGLGVSLRWNLRVRVIEFKDSSADGDSQWETASDRKTADLRERIAKRYWYKARTAPETVKLRFSREGWHDSLNAIAYHNEVDPFLIWLEGLPAWDGIPRIEHILCDLFGAEDNDLTRWASRAPFVGAVQRTLFPGSKIDESPILISEVQGYGKSGLAYSLGSGLITATR